MTDDGAYMSRSIPNSQGWSLIFTLQGRYFFHHPESQTRTWLPSKSLLSLIHGQFNNPIRLARFFDPGEEMDDESESEGNEEASDDEGDLCQDSEGDLEPNGRFSPSAVQPSPASQINAEQDFRDFLLSAPSSLIDPFAPWNQISLKLVNEPSFQALSIKQRERIFLQACLSLIEQCRNERNLKLLEAQRWYQSRLLEYTSEIDHRTATWFDFLKKIRADPRFSLLNQKECEKLFRTHVNIQQK